MSAGLLPSSLTHLTFGPKFNHSISAGVLPASVTHLSFGSGFQQPLSVVVLPQSLKLLILGRLYDPSLLDSLPKSVIVSYDEAISTQSM